MMSKLIDITGKALSGEWGTDDELGDGIPVLRTTNFTNDGVVNYKDVITRKITKKNISDKFLRKGDIIIEKSGGSDKQPVGRVIYFEGDESTYLFNNFTGLLRVKDTSKWIPKYVFYSLFFNYQKGGTRSFENKTTGLHNLKTDIYISSFDVQDVDIQTQEIICNQLDSIRNTIQLRKQQLQQLDELVKARFVELFGDVLTNEKSWETAIWNDVLTIKNGKNQKQVENPTGQYPICGSGGIMGYADNYISEANSVIIGRKGNINKPILMREKYWNVDTAFGLEPNNKFLLVDFLFLFCVLFDFEKLNKAVTIPSLTKADLLKIEIPIPPIELQNEFADFVKQIDKSKFIKTNYN